MEIFYLIESIGIISFALSGFLIAVKHDMDFLGIFLISFLTALGGGIIRDTIVDRIPLSFIDTIPALLVVLTVILSTLLKFNKKENIDRKNLFIATDAIGLSSFAISGALAAIAFEFNLFGVIILSFITAVGGGIIRDVLINHIPLILKKDFYGTIVIIIAVTIYILESFEFLNNITIMLIFILGVIIRMIAFHHRWHIPSIK
ncbi:MAG: TRIC cation channel family protein [Campylobacterota bacterium]|nr:TRIC cation channel family protein [Campylobacterota bacterium]